MRSIAYISTLIAFAAAGCSVDAYYWYNPAKTLEEAECDCRQCYRDAVAEASQAVAEHCLDRAMAPDQPDIFAPDIASSSLDREVLSAWSGWASTYQWNVFNGCMKRQGYRRIKADQIDQAARKKSLSIDKVAGR